MRLSIKTLTWLWAGILLILSILFFTAYSRLKPDSLVSSLNEQVKRSYPGSKLTVGEVKYFFSIDFSLNLKDLTLVRKNNVIARVGEVELKVPWWLILFDRGNAQVNLSSLTIFVSNEQGPNILGTSSKPKQSKVKVALPDYLLDANYTLRAKDVSIRELDGDRSYFTLSKLLVREFQYGRNSAFELNIPISITHKNHKYTSELWLFGDVTPDVKKWVLNYRGEIKTRETNDGFHLDDLVIDGKAQFDPLNLDVKSNLGLMVEGDEVGKGELTAKYDEFKVKVDVTQLPLSFLSLAGDEIKNPYWEKIEGVAEGFLEFRRDLSKKKSAHFIGKLDFPGKFTLDSNTTREGKWRLNFNNSIWETSFLTPNGEVSYFRRAVVDFKQGAVSQYSEEIGFSSTDLKDAMLVAKNFESFLSNPEKAYHSSLLSIKKCMDGEIMVDGFFRHGLSPGRKFYQMELTTTDSKMNLNYQQKLPKNNLTLEFKNFAWNPIYKFFEPLFTTAEGILNGKLEGNWSKHWSDGTWISKLNIKEMKKSEGEFLQLAHEAWNLFEIDSKIFPQQSWHATVDNNRIKINAFSIQSSDPIRLTGSLSTNPKRKSYLTLSYPKNKRWKPVRKEVKDIFWKKESL